jgi:hypothetical protein
MATMTRGAIDSLDEARQRLDHRFDEVAREYAGHPRHEVLSVLEREVCAAGITPTRADLSALAQQIADAATTG